MMMLRAAPDGANEPPRLQAMAMVIISILASSGSSLPEAAVAVV